MHGITNAFIINNVSTISIIFFYIYIIPNVAQLNSMFEKSKILEMMENSSATTFIQNVHSQWFPMGSYIYVNGYG